MDVHHMDGHKGLALLGFAEASKRLEVPLRKVPWTLAHS